jgi:hypothetical protein
VGISAGLNDGRFATLTFESTGIIQALDSSKFQRGFNIILLVGFTSASISFINFDLFSESSDRMLTFLRSLSDGTVVVVLAMDAIDVFDDVSGAYDPMSTNVKPDLKAFMANAFQASKFGFLDYLDGYVLVAVKNGGAPLAEERTVSGSGVASVTAVIPCASLSGRSIKPSQNPTNRPSRLLLIFPTFLPSPMPSTQPTQSSVSKIVQPTSSPSRKSIKFSSLSQRPIMSPTFHFKAAENTTGNTSGTQAEKEGANTVVIMITVSAVIFLAVLVFGKCLVCN